MLEVDVYNLNNTTGVYTRIGELVTYSDLRWTESINDVKSAYFNINMFSSEGRFIQPFKTWVLIKKDGSPRFFGEVVHISGEAGPSTGRIRVACASILYRLKSLFIEGTYVKQNTDASTIASELISIAQAKGNSNLGIQAGVLQTVGTTNETLFYQSIGEALVNQSDNIVGYVFTFVPILDANGKLSYIQFNVLQGLGDVRDDLPPLELGYSVNVVDFNMGEELANQIYVLGQGTGDVEVTTSENSDSKIFYGRRELIQKEPSISIKTTLQTRGDKLLNIRKGVQLEVAFELTPSVKPYYGDFMLGDTLKVDVRIGNTFFNFQGYARVKELQFGYDNDNNKESLLAIVEYYRT